VGNVGENSFTSALFKIGIQAPEHEISDAYAVRNSHISVTGMVANVLLALYSKLSGLVSRNPYLDYFQGGHGLSAAFNTAASGVSGV
jgi:hypothetical protein